MKISVINTAGAAAGVIEVADELIISNGKGTQAVHDAIVAYRANQRLGTHSTKMIGDVAGSCLLYTSPSPRDGLLSRMPSSA